MDIPPAALDELDREEHRAQLLAAGNERDLANRYLARLNQSFTVEREIRGTHCTGERLRIDAVIRPRDPSGWKDPSCAFGVEFKRPPGSLDTNNFTRWAAQAVDYTHTDWDGYGRLMIFTCPAISPHLTIWGDRASGLVMRMLGQLGVGEIIETRHYGLTLMLHGSHRLWSERDGVVFGRQWTLRVKVGSR